MQIGERNIGPGHPCYIVAEACDNHLGSVARAFNMIHRAKLAGADAIKFQHHLPDAEMLPDVPRSDNFAGASLYDFIKANALSLDAHRALMAECRRIDIQYLCTPFSWPAACELESIGVDAFKIGSGELSDLPFISRVAQFALPMIVSTGMSTWDEIDRTYALLTSREHDADIALLNCVSEYPPAYDDVNIDVLTEMKRRYPLAVVGHSDHTPDLYTSFAAVTLGACIIEKHVTLDKATPGPDQSVSIDFKELVSLVDGIRKIESSRGSMRRVHAREAKIREWAHRSLVTLRPLRVGDVIKSEDLWSKRPGTGIPSWRMDEYVGRRVVRDVAVNALLADDDVEAR